MNSLIEYQDLVALSKSCKETGRLDFNSWEIMEDPTSRDRLVKAKLVSAKGFLTELGKKYLVRIEEKVSRLSSGVPLKDSPVASLDPLTLFSVAPRSQWFKVNVGKTAYTNGMILMFTDLFPTSEGALDVEKEARAKIIRSLRDFVKGEYCEVTPFFYQLKFFGDPGLVWLQAPNFWVAVGAKYFAFINYIYEEPKYFAKGSNEVLHIRESPYKVKDTKAFLMPFKETFNIKYKEGGSGAV
jgi:hypothetical protein